MTKRSYSLTILVPCYNESKSLMVLLPKLVKFCEDNKIYLLIVNDGSIDNSLKIINSYISESKLSNVISHHNNLGYGAALKTGIHNAQTDYIVTFDADGQHSIRDILRLHKHLISTNSDLVIGTRKANEKNLYRSFGKWIIRRLTSLLIGLDVKDLNSGIKIYKKDTLVPMLQFVPNNMAFSDLIVIIFFTERKVISELDVSINKRIAGQSSINIKVFFETISAIFNAVIFFKPMRVFSAISLILFLGGLFWGSYIFSFGGGLSIGAFLLITLSALSIFFGVLASQISNLWRAVNERTK